MRKNCSSVILSFLQVTKIEKRASTKRFLKSRRSRDFEMFSRCPFFNRGNLEKTSNYTRTIFLQFARTIMTTDCFFAMFWFFCMKIRFFVLKSEEKKGHLENIPKSRLRLDFKNLFLDALFSTLVTWKKLKITLEQFFLTVCLNNYDNNSISRYFFTFEDVKGLVSE